MINDYLVPDYTKPNHPTFEDLRSAFIYFISSVPMVYNNEKVLRAYERVFNVMDKLEERYIDHA